MHSGIIPARHVQHAHPAPAHARFVGPCV